MSALAVAAGMLKLRVALAAGAVQSGVAQVKGQALINGKPAVRGQRVTAGDVVETGKGGVLVVVVDKDAFLVRGNSRIEFGAAATKGRGQYLACGNRRVVVSI